MTEIDRDILIITEEFKVTPIEAAKMSYKIFQLLYPMDKFLDNITVLDKHSKEQLKLELL